MIPIGGSEDEKNAAVALAKKKDLAKSKYEGYTKEDVVEEEAMFETEYSKVLKDLETFTSKKEVADTVETFKDIDGLVGRDLLEALLNKLNLLERKSRKQPKASVEKQQVPEEVKGDTATIAEQEITTVESNKLEHKAGIQAQIVKLEELLQNKGLPTVIRNMYNKQLEQFKKGCSI